MNLKTAIQATEITEYTERAGGLCVSLAHPKGESISRYNLLFFLCDLCVLCG